jgi:hypothetical protein
MATAFDTSAPPSISRILERMCVNLQLSIDQVDQATQSYGAITEWLTAEGSKVRQFAPLLFPQGSLALDTTVRPVHQNQFDLDIVCRLSTQLDWTPDEMYELIWDRMAEHGTYRGMMKREKRCIRLEYHDDAQFHLDIVPAVRDRSQGGTFLQIADRVSDDRMIWKPSNPKGFKEWFDAQKVVLFEKYAKAHIEPLHQPLPAAQKATLTKAVQLLKRWRDVRWKDDPKMATPSIMLTYLAADYYGGQEDLVAAMTAILTGINAFVASGETVIISPANPKEIISEKWIDKPESYGAFAEAVAELRQSWNNIVSKCGPALGDALQELFGDQAARAIKDISQPISDARANGNLFTEKKSGALIQTASAAVGARIAPNTFFGN